MTSVQDNSCLDEHPRTCDSLERRKRKRQLPSPSTSGSWGNKLEALSGASSEENVSQRNSLPSQLCGRRSSRLSLNPYSSDKEEEYRGQSAEITSGPLLRQKRRRLVTTQDVVCEAENPEGTGLRTLLPRTGCLSSEKSDTGDPIEVWTRTGRWPTDFATMSQERSGSPQKRSRTPSYNQSVAQGDAPSPYSAAFEKYIAERGLYMRELQGRALVNAESKSLCQQLLNGNHQTPQNTSYPLSQFLLVWDQARGRNEARIFRDLTPLLVPSPELLWVGGNQGLEHIRDELSVEWNKGKPMAGPKPKPDFAVGVARDAFTEEELVKLRNHTSFERQTFFTDNMLFPFLLCETKCGNEGLDRADRQNMHSASMAIDALIHLYRALGDGRERDLSGQVLAFSISHNHDTVKIYGHFPIFQADRTCFYRYHITTFTLGLGDDDWKKPHDLTMEIYQTFHPQHLRRIQNALKDMPNPDFGSMDDNIQENDASSQEIADTASSSQDTTTFKLPHAPASKRQKNELTLLREQLAKQEQQHKEQMAKQEQQMAKQEQQHKEQMAKQEQQMSKQEQQYKEQIDLLKRLVEQRH